MFGMPNGVYVSCEDLDVSYSVHAVTCICWNSVKVALHEAVRTGTSRRSCVTKLNHDKTVYHTEVSLSAADRPLYS